MAEWEKKTKTFKRKKKQQKQQAHERGEETDCDDDEEYDEVVTDIEWGDLESEDALTGTHSSMQGPFPFHAGEDEAVRPKEEAGRTVGPSLGSSGANGSATTLEVPVEESDPTAMP